ncbi:MAG: metal ABC transporter ATP-binding protein [Candidatus Promineifilaceae bacterium]
MTLFLNKQKERGISHIDSAPTVEAQSVYATYTPGSNGRSHAPTNPQENSRRESSRRYALEDVSFRIDTGDRVAIVGPNGAGKTTLFKLIVGTLRPVKGSIQVYGRNPDHHICIAYVPQHNQIDWSFPVTAEDVVMMGRVGQIGLFHWPKRRDWDIVHSSLEKVSASHLAKERIGDLSGGQRQRIFIARALAQEADLLLMDEPLNGLDLPSQEKIFQIWDMLRKDGVTIMVATHDLNLAADAFDQIMLLNQKLVGFGRPSEVLTSANLLHAYGGHVHLLGQDGEGMVLVDDCCDPV